MEQPIAARERVFDREPLVHRHDFVQVVFPSWGRLDLTVERSRGAVGGARFAVVQPGDEHICWSSAGASCLIVDVSQEIAKLPGSRFDLMTGRMGLVRQILCAEVESGGIAEPLIASGLATYLSGALFRGSDVSELVGGRRIAAMARDFIEGAYTGSFALDELAREVGASVSHLQRSFRAEFGVGIVDYTVERRLGHAAELLISTDLPVTSIAARSGFDSASYFSSRFSRRHAVSPQRFRERVRAESRMESPQS